MFDTHCHLNFKAFQGDVDGVVERAKKAGVNLMIVPGTDLEMSEKAVKIAEIYGCVYAAVGIHPHHAMDINLEDLISTLSKFLVHPKVVAVGEVGIDKHQYTKTKHQNYQVERKFIERQKEILRLQINLAIKHKKAIIIHNRESTADILELLIASHYPLTTMRIVFHCCEPDERLLKFAIKNNIYIGVDGDVTYRADKQEFVQKIPLELLVAETDSPYLLPEPLRSKKLFPNEPKNVALIAEFIAKLKNTPVNRIMEATMENSKKLFSL